MNKKIMIILKFIILTSFFIHSKNYEVIPIKINELNFSVYRNVFNEIKKVGDKIYIYCNKDFYKRLGDDGFLYSIIELDNNYNVVNERILKNKIKFGSFENYYYINDKGEIAFHNDDFEGGTTSSVIDIYNIQDNLIRRIDTKIPIKYMVYYYDSDSYLYYIGIPFDPQDDGYFYIYKDRKDNKKINYNDFKEPVYEPLFVYLIGSDKYIASLDLNDLVIFNKASFYKDKKINAIKKIDLSKYYYRQTNLMSYTRSNEGAKVKGNIFYQIKFLGNYEKEKPNNQCEVRGKIKSLQTLLIGIDVETEKQVKEIKINYTERYVNEAPNSYNIDEDGTIYMLDSKGRNIIRIDKDTEKLEIDYKY